MTDLNKEPFLLLKEGHCFRDSVISACHEARVKPVVAFESGEFATILGMVSVGMGVSAVPAMAVRAQAGCTFIPIADPLGMRTVGIVRLRHHFETRSQRSFRAHMASACGQMHSRGKRLRGRSSS